jgi:ribosomal protein L40E
LSENGNGELAALLSVKRGYKNELVNLEAELRSKFDRDLAEGKKALKENYLEQIVDVIFAEAAFQEPEKKQEPPARVVEPKPSVCSECGAKLDLGAKFCSQCANPVEEEEKNEGTAVVSTSRIHSSRGRS